MKINFDFISDDNFRDILQRDFEELNKCIEIKASKSVLILSGSIIEAILTDYFINFPPEDKSPRNILGMTLYDLLELGAKKNLISQSTKELSTVIRNYRNLIHPGREIRKCESFDNDTAIVAKSLLNIIVRELRENYLNNLGYSATDIIQKLENDSVSQPIFEIILKKIHKNEKTKLYNTLIDYDLDESLSFNRIEDPKKYIRILKPQIDREVIKGQLKKLIYKIETGEEWEVMFYYSLLYEDLSYLEKENLELVLLYVLNVLSESTINFANIEKYVDKNIYSSFGAHLKTESIKREFLRFVSKLVRNTSENRTLCYFQAYDQLVNSVSTNERDEIKVYVINNTIKYYQERFYKVYNNGDYVPF